MSESNTHAGPKAGDLYAFEVTDRRLGLSAHYMARRVREYPDGSGLYIELTDHPHGPTRTVSRDDEGYFPKGIVPLHRVIE